MNDTRGEPHLATLRLEKGVPFSAEDLRKIREAAERVGTRVEMATFREEGEEEGI